MLAVNRVLVCSIVMVFAIILQVSIPRNSAHATGQVVTDAKGRKVTIKDASRIVSIGGSVTEIIYALGEQDRIIARDSTSVFPSAVQSKKNIGYMRALSSEGVLSVKPTLVLSLEGAGPPEVIDVLEKASVPFITVPHKFSEQGIIEKIAFIGRVLGVPEKSDELIKKVKQDFAALRKITAGIKNKKKVMFILSLRGGRVLASGENTAASAIIRMAGARNAVNKITGYKPLANEAIIKSNPDAILMMDRGGSHSTGSKELFRIPSFLATPAAKTKSLMKFNGLYLLGFGPRTASAARELAEKLYGVK